MWETREYVVSRGPRASLSTAKWEELSHTAWLPKGAVASRFQALHDGQRLYIRMEAEETPIRAVCTGPLDSVCEDSCLEFFIAPEPGERYFNFEINPLGTLCLGFGGRPPDRVRQVPRNMEQFRIRPYEKDAGWGVMFEIPLSFLRLYFPQFSFSGKAAANFYKCGEKTERPHYLAWSPLISERPDFHRRQDFGTLVFE